MSTRRQVLRVGITAAIGSWAALELIGLGEASAAPASPTATRISMVGDSLTVGSVPFQADAFSSAGWSHSAIDGYLSRGVRTKLNADRYTGLTAVDAIRAKSGDSDAWVVALGTNDALIYYSHGKQAEVIRQMMDRIGVGHKVLWANVYLPLRLPLQLSWNATLDAVAAERDDMFVYDWATFAAENPRWMLPDGIHYLRDGYRYRSTAIGLASRDLLPADFESQLPPRWKVPRVGPPSH